MMCRRGIKLDYLSVFYNHVYMVYLIGTIGFLAGFALGVIILNKLLADRSRAELCCCAKLLYSFGQWVISVNLRIIERVILWARIFRIIIGFRRHFIG